MDSEDKALFKVGLLSDELTGTFLTLDLLLSHDTQNQLLGFGFKLSSQKAYLSKGISVLLHKFSSISFT